MSPTRSPRALLAATLVGVLAAFAFAGHVLDNREGGFRCTWLARLTRGRIGLGRWTKAEIDRINAAAKAEFDEFQKYVQ